MALRLHGIGIMAPSGKAPIRADAHSGVESVAMRLGAAQGTSEVVATQQEFNIALERFADQTSLGDISILFIQGHGQRIPGNQRTEAVNLLLTPDSIGVNLGPTSIDVDNSLSKLRGSVRGSTLVVVDACGVDVHRTLHGGADMAVLLAAPGTEARVADQGSGLLTRYFVDSLDRAEHGGRSLRELIKAANDKVIEQTEETQVPSLESFGADAFLDAPFPPKTGTHGSLEGQVIHWLSGWLDEDSPSALVEGLYELLKSENPKGLRLQELVLATRAARLIDYRCRDDIELRDDVVKAVTRWHEARSGIRARAHHAAGLAWLTVGNAERAGNHLDQAHQLAEEGSSQATRAQVLNSRALAHRTRHIYNMAEKDLTASKSIKESIGDDKGLEMSRLSLGWTGAARGKFTRSRDTFAEGVTACLERLEEPRSDKGRDPAILLARLSSLCFHLEGLLTMLLVDLASPNEFAQLEARVSDWLPLAKELERWAGKEWKAPVRSVNLLLALGKEQAPPPLEDGEPATDYLRTALQLSEQGPRDELIQRFDESAEKLLKSASAYDLAPLFRHAALLHFIAAQAENPVPLTQVRDDLIGRMAEDWDLDALRADSPPWVMITRPPELRLDTSKWWKWGPLALQVQHASREEIYVTSQVTEHYLQHLGWTCLLQIALEAGLSSEQVCKHLIESGVFHAQSSIQFNLGQSLGAARLVAELALDVPRLGEHGQRLAGLFAENQLVAGTHYADNKKISEERNRMAHKGAYTVSEVAQVLEQHQRAIQNVVDVLDEGPSIKCRATNRTVDSSRCFVSVELSHKRAELDCGPLLIARGDCDSTLYVPHRLMKASMAPGEDKVRKSEYERQDVANYENAAPVVAIKIKTPFPDM